LDGQSRRRRSCLWGGRGERAEPGFKRKSGELKSEEEGFLREHRETQGGFSFRMRIF
jgi:hypothetical protein